MSKRKNQKNNLKKQKYLLPILAAISIIAAMIVLFVLPAVKSNSVVADPDETYIQINVSDLSNDQITFIRLGNGSKIELLARKGDDDLAKVALGTCQSCNGSPGAYYTQEGDLLKCNNCGLTFPLSVLDEPGSGCHPITIDEDMISRNADGIAIDIEKLRNYEGLFAKVDNH